MTDWLWSLVMVGGPFLIVAFFAVRNDWVYRQRMRLNDECYARKRRSLDAGEHPDMRWWDEYYLSYDQMFWRFWCWDVEKMRLS